MISKTKMEKKQERRKYKRVKIAKVDAGYRLVDPKFWAEFRSKGNNLLRDISLSGVSFKSGDSLPKNSVLCLELKLGNMIKIGDICGRIVRVRKLENEEYEIGVNFSWWAKEEDKVRVIRYLDAV